MSTSEPSLSLCSSFFMLVTIWPFCCVLSLPENCFASFASCYWFVFMHSLPICWQNFFHFLECSILFVLPDPVSVFFKIAFFHQYFFIYLFKLHCQTCLLYYFGLFIPTCLFSFLACFFFFNTSTCFCNFFICPSSLISPPGFFFLFGFLKGTLILSLNSFASA